MGTPRTVLGYVRVSTAEQARSGLGLDAQRDAIEAECGRRQWRLQRLYDDPGVSGKALTHRPGLAAAMAVLAAGKADALVVAKLDRLSRSVRDFSEIVATARAQRWQLVVLDVQVDTTTPSGELLANVMASFAQFERQIISQRIREALAVKRANGARLGRPRLLPADTVEAIVSARASGQTLQDIADQLNASGVATAQGGRRWWPSTVRAVLASAALDRVHA